MQTQLISSDTQVTHHQELTLGWGLWPQGEGFVFPGASTNQMLTALSNSLYMATDVLLMETNI